MRLFFILFCLHVSLFATTYYVSPDGGRYGECDGLSGEANNSSGRCAWSHPFEALGVMSDPKKKGKEFSRSTFKRHIKGGDTLIIKNGSYRMGYTKGVYSDTTECYKKYPEMCRAAPIPSGTKDRPTRILGADWNKGCKNKPELFGVEKTESVLDASGDHIEIQCLNITDHDTCLYGHGQGVDNNFNSQINDSQKFPCNQVKNPEGDVIYGNYALSGIVAEHANYLYLKNIDIQGISVVGIRTTNQKKYDPNWELNTGGNWTLEKVRLTYNGNAGWDGGHYVGKMVVKDSVINYNGCSLSYPEKKIQGCWGQIAGGYGDGIGLFKSHGDWIFDNVEVKYNTSDGLDLLYLENPSSIRLNKIYAEGNAGNQVKFSSSNGAITNSVLIGNCRYFDKKDFVYGLQNCRAYGNTLSVTILNNGKVDVQNISIYGEGDTLFEVIGERNETEVLKMRNIVGVGDSGSGSGEKDKTAYMYNKCNNITIDHDEEYYYNLKPNGIKIYIDHKHVTNFTEKRGSNVFYQDPKVIKADAINDIFNLMVEPESEALGYGAYDKNGKLKNERLRNEVLAPVYYLLLN